MNQINMSRDIPIQDIETINLIKNEYRRKKNYRELLFFLLAINTGLKTNEILNLNVKDVKHKNYIIVEHCLSKTTKRVPLNEEIQEIINILIKDKPDSYPLFTSQKGNRLNRISAYNLFKATCETLGLDKRFSISSLRKTFGYHYYQKYKDLSFLQWMFNQNMITQTMKYIGINEDMNFRYRKDFSL